ncbi:MAG TPA: molybdate ABC transporter permease subunit, partial [Rhizobiales bacterium]|nr:molybdate ABC transporter permease subunit [Hyphomicrobiales bacterium]
MDLTAIWLTIQLAGITTLALLVIATPLAWWLAFTRSRLKPVIEAITALPLVLPPTVLGFYFLVVFGPAGGLGKWWLQLTGTTLTFSFTGLVIASMIYSLPFVVQPLSNAFAQTGHKPLEEAASLGASPIDRFFTVALPLSKRGFLTAAILGFAHTVGEFGVVLMVGGNIPGKTRVISISIFENVETLNFTAAHQMSAILIVFSFTVLLAV